MSEHFVRIAIFYLFLFVTPTYSQIYFSENFESGLANWKAYYDGYQIWDTTSIFSHSGKYSLTESPKGNYDAGTSTCILTVDKINLENSDSPILSFWHRYNTEYSNDQGVDFCRIEISSNSGFTWKEIKSYSGNQDSWSNEIVDLKKYKGEEIKIKFRLTDSYANWNGNSQQDGWYIDDIEVKEPERGKQIIYPFKDDFENGLSNWTISGSDWNTTNLTSDSGKYSITDSPDGNYIKNANSIIALTGDINLAYANYPVLYFSHKYNTNEDKDYCCVEISTDLGFTWNVLNKYSGYQHSWERTSIRLNKYSKSSIRIRFRLLSSTRSPEDGWYIDNVEIKEIDAYKLVALPFTDSFEIGLKKWVTDGTGWKITTGSSSNGEQSLIYYPGSDSSKKITPIIKIDGTLNLTVQKTPMLSFYQKYCFKDKNDFCRLEVSDDFGESWFTIKKYNGCLNDWKLEEINLSIFKNKLIQIRFVLPNDSQSKKLVWLIDNVIIKGS